MKKTLSKLLLLVATAGLSLVSAANVRIICDYPITLKDVLASDGSLLGDITLEKDTWYSTNYDITQCWNISYGDQQCPELSTNQTLTAELDGYRCKGWYTLQSNDANKDGSMTRLSSCNTDSPLAAGQKGQAAVSINLSEKLRYAKTSAYMYFYSDPPAAVICPLFVKAWTIKTSVSPEGMGETAGGGLIDDGDSTTLVASNPADGYRFVRWEKDGELVSENSTYKFDPTGDGTYTAVFALPPRDLTITTSVSPKGKGMVTGGGDCKEGDSIVLAATPTNGYAFAGWTNATGVISTENPWEFTAADDLVCVAVFTSRWYQISFTDSAGTPPEPVLRRFDEPMGELPRPIYENPYLSFTRWLDVNGNAVTAETILTNAADQTLHADVPSERTKYRIVFVDPSGECKPSAVTNYVQKGDQVTEMMAARFSRPGFWQTGWDLVLPFEATGDCEVSAVWKSLSDVLDCKNLAFSIEPNSNWKIVEDDKHAGDSSLRINARSDASDVVSTSVKEPGRLSFWWKGDARTVLTVKFGGDTSERFTGAAEMAWTQATIEIKNASVGKPVDVLFSFVTGDFGDYCALDDVSWKTGIEYELSVVVDPSTPHGTVTKDPELDSYADGSSVTIAAKACEGYCFEKWNDGVTESNRTVTVSGNASYTASFTACVYRVTLSQNGGMGGTNEVRATYQKSMPTIKDLPALNGYAFLGYFDESAGGAQYYDNEGKGVALWDKAADSTLYAQWQKDNKEYSLTIESADETRGTIAKDPDKDAYLTGDYVTISATANDGYAFEQWSDGVTKSNRSVTVSGDASYTASFTACVYRVVLNANGGTDGQAEAWASYRERLPDLTQLPTKDGSKFNGYYDSATGGAMYYDADGHGLANWLLASNAELFAHWTQNAEVDVGDVSRALDCDNLVFEKTGAWTIKEDEWYYVDGEGNDGKYLDTQTSKEALTTTVRESGTLEFYWCCGIGQTTLEVRTNGTAILTKSITNKEDNMEYQHAAADIEVSSGSSVKLSILCSKVESYCDIDYLSWTPDVAPTPTGGATEVPSAIAGLIYDGNAQTGVVEGVNYTIVGNVATNAGTYTATVMLTNGEWTGGGTEPTNISWSIAKAQVVMSGIVFTNATYEADGEPKSIFVTGELPAGVTNVTYEGNGQAEAGNYKVTAKFVVDGNHESVADKTATLTITAKEEPPTPPEPPEPVVTNEVPVAVHGLVYNGNAQTGVVAGVNYTIVGNVATNAGDYTATATVTIGVWEGGYAGPTNITWSIAKAAAPDVSGVTFAGATYEYDGESHSIAVSGTIPVGVEVIYSGETNRTEVGTNTVTVSFKVLDEANYEKIETTLTAKLIITAKEEPPTPPDPPGPVTPDPPGPVTPDPPGPFDPRIAFENIYFKASLADLGATAVPTNRKITIKTEGLPKGLKLVTTALKDAKNKATGYYAYAIEGAPTEMMDGTSRIAYVRVTDNKVQTLYALDLSVLPAAEFEQKMFPDGTNKVGYLRFCVTNLWPDVAVNPKNWTFSGWPSGIKYATKDTNDAKTYEVYGTPTKAGRFTVKAIEKIAGTSYKSTHVATFTVWPDVCDPESEWTDPAHEGVYRASAGDVTAASGLPTGVKFTAKDIVAKGEVTTEAHHFYGTPTKAGTYAVALTHEDKSKTGFLWTITPAAAPSFELQLTETEVDPVSVKATVRAGVSYDWLIDCTSNATVTASGLPTGLKLVKTAVKDGTKTIGYTYSVAGVPTKAGEFFTTFTTKLNGISTVTTAAFTVLDLPAWAQGAFDGGVGASETSSGGQVTLTVSKAGKLSGKWLSLGTNWTLSATSYARYDRENDCYYAEVVCKTGSGKRAVSVTEELRVSSIALGGLAESDRFSAYQNNWKLEPWKTVGKPFSKAKELVCVPEGYATNDTISLKFAASGKVTVKGKFVKSISDKGKITWYSASGSAVLCPQTEPDGTGAFGGYVFVYLPPKAKTPLEDGGYAVCVRLRWDGEKFVEEPVLE